MKPSEMTKAFEEVGNEIFLLLQSKILYDRKIAESRLSERDKTERDKIIEECNAKITQKNSYRTSFIKFLNEDLEKTSQEMKDIFHGDLSDEEKKVRLDELSDYTGEIYLAISKLQ